MSPMGVSPHERCSPKRVPRDGDGYGGGKDLRLLPSRQGDAGGGVCRASLQGGGGGCRPGGRSRGDRGGDPRRVYHRRIGEGRPSPRAGRGGEPPRGGKPPEADRALSPDRGAFPGRGGHKRQDGGSVSCAGAERGGGPPHRGGPVSGKGSARRQLSSSGDPLRASRALRAA